MRSILSLVVLLCGSGVAAQTEAYTPGYLIVDGARVSAELALGTEAENARGVRARFTDGTVRTIGPRDADGFGVEGGRAYRSDLFRIRATSDPSAATPDHVDAFARVVREGPVGLLALERVLGRPQFFLAGPEDDLVGLYAPGRGAGRLGELYRQALLVTLDGCPSHSLPVEDVRYSEAALAAIVDAYNACVDPAYAPPVAAAPPRRGPPLALEAGVGYQAGTFHRRRETPFDDPRPAAVQVRAAVVTRTWLAPERLRLYLGLTYDHDVFHFIEGFPTRRRTQLSVASVDLGARLRQPVPGATLTLGAGLLAGRTLTRTVQDDVVRDDEADAARDLLPGHLQASSGQYAELGLELDGFPMALRLRLQETAFSGSPTLLPVVSSARYRIRSVGVTAVARL